MIGIIKEVVIAGVGVGTHGLINDAVCEATIFDATFQGHIVFDAFERSNIALNGSLRHLFQQNTKSAIFMIIYTVIRTILTHRRSVTMLPTRGSLLVLG